MSRCEILLEDDGEHAAVRFVYPDGFEPASPSHRMSNIIRGVLDEMFEPITAREDHGDVAALPAAVNPEVAQKSE